ncbi:hypothetical protein GPECTOR_61g854 [Gonium pectorale]|uniref:Rhodanese domain-containing protein n=1 Tax=Gonium pectorale TaxID=33097 RepID=A0A150G502_GONPE|nr:hypothetical protein GPECTOR_61g854 [Gonium pectorale]|eukprot:KXZ44901.1 hypothetical protein GPECTOR_61g854 [Gonium pectorale]
MRELAALYGVRVADDSQDAGSSGRGRLMRGGERRLLRGDEEEDEEDDEDAFESWEEAVAELGNPWDMRPARAAPLAGGGGSGGGGGGGGSAYLDSTARSRVGSDELRDLLRAAAGDSGSGRAAVVLVDVRDEAEAAAGPRPSPDPAALLPPGAPPSLLWRRCVPLAGLRRGEAEELEAGADYVVVLGSGDHRAEQAVVRLTKVYGLRRVLLYDGE